MIDGGEEAWGGEAGRQVGRAGALPAAERTLP